MTIKEEQILRESIRKMVKESLNEGVFIDKLKNIGHRWHPGTKGHIYNNSLYSKAIGYVEPLIRRAIIDYQTYDKDDYMKNRDKILKFLFEFTGKVDEAKKLDDDIIKKFYQNDEYKEYEEERKARAAEIYKQRNGGKEKPKQYTVDSFDFDDIAKSIEKPELSSAKKQELKQYVDIALACIDRTLSDGKIKDSDAAAAAKDVISSLL